ncbi:hypothetical protein F4824DRAFT_51250 [Ustulina deusta]|nr:hypothetical protein F4824DRAFT_51250 [Ustulina deusta]
MLCCGDVNAAKEAEATARRIMPWKRTKFGLGVTDLPLRHPGPRPPGLPFPPPSVPTPPPSSSVSRPTSLPLSLNIVDFDSKESGELQRPSTRCRCIRVASRPRVGGLLTAEFSRALFISLPLVSSLASDGVSTN